MKIIDKLKKLIDLWRKPDQFSFIQPHYFVSEKEMNELRHIIAEMPEDTVAQFEQEIAKVIGDGQAVAMASARMSFYSLLLAINIEAEDEVIIPAFTCSVMVNSILRAGATPVYCDINESTMGPDPKDIKEKTTSRTKMIVAQHSFGIPCEIKDIVEFAHKNNIFLLEDSAITFDSIYHGISVGNWGDAAIFSMDHNKPLNTLIGGILYSKNPVLINKVRGIQENIMSLSDLHQIKLYDQLKKEWKYMYPNKWSKNLLKELIKGKVTETLVKLHVISGSASVFLTNEYRNPAFNYKNDYPYPAKYPPFLAKLGMYCLREWGNEKDRRVHFLKQCINIFIQNKKDHLLPKAYFDANIDIVPLRLIFTCSNTEEIKLRLSKVINVYEFWFLLPIVMCPDPLETLGYNSGDCPGSEKIGRSIINIPCNIVPGWEERLIDILDKIVPLLR
jgi:hypothetical protein